MHRRPSAARQTVRQGPTLLLELRRALRERKITHQGLADRLKVSLATVKRWLAGRGLTLDSLEDICNEVGISLTELLASVAEQSPTKIARLTLAQERALAQNSRLTFLFFSLLNGWPPEEFAREFHLQSELVDQDLGRLERLGLIDRLGTGRVRPLASRRVTWRRGGPLAQHFEAQVKKLFLDADFGSDEVIYLSDVAKLSAAATSQIEALLDRFREEFHAIAELDRHSPAARRTWQGILFVARSLDPDGLTFERERIVSGQPD